VEVDGDLGVRGAHVEVDVVALAALDGQGHAELAGQRGAPHAGREHDLARGDVALRGPQARHAAVAASQAEDLDARADPDAAQPRVLADRLDEAQRVAVRLAGPEDRAGLVAGQGGDEVAGGGAAQHLRRTARPGDGGRERTRPLVHVEHASLRVAGVEPARGELGVHPRAVGREPLKHREPLPDARGRGGGEEARDPRDERRARRHREGAAGPPEPAQAVEHRVGPRERLDVGDAHDPGVALRAAPAEPRPALQQLDRRAARRELRGDAHADRSTTDDHDIRAAHDPHVARSCRYVRMR
jgi:hypothetical protein